MNAFTPAAPPAPAASQIGLGAFYNQLFQPRGFALAPHHYPMVAALEDMRIQNLLMMMCAGGGKSNLVDIAYPCWRLGRDPTLAILSISAGERLPQTFLQASMSIIQDDPSFRRHFPNVRPDKGVGWSLERGLFVTGHHPGDENPSYFCVGLQSKALTGLHCREMILDDIHDEENAATSEMRSNVIDRYYRTLLDRADPRGCRRVAIGRWWAEDDLYQEFMRNGEFVVMSLPATRPGARRLWYDVLVPDGMICVFTETGERAPETEQVITGMTKYRAYYAAVDPTGQGFYWPASPIKRKNYLAVKRRKPRIAAINYDGDMTGGGTAIFTEADFRWWNPPEDLHLGAQAPGVRGLVRETNGTIEEAWDTALGQPQSTSMTAALTGLLVPCNQWHRGEDEALVGPCDFHYDVWLLDLLLAHLDAGGLAMALRERYGKWLPRMISVEEKQSGVGLLQAFRGTHIPLRGQKVAEGKIERAISAVLLAENGLPLGGGGFSVQGWIKMGRVLAPQGVAWVTDPHGEATQGFLKTVCAFAGGGKPSDEFDALIHLVTRAIMLSGRTAHVPGMDNAGRFTGGPPDMDAETFRRVMETDPRAAALGAFGAMTASPAAMDLPFAGMCGAPCHYYGVFDNAERCKHTNHPRVTHALEGCTDWAQVGSIVEQH